MGNGVEVPGHSHVRRRVRYEQVGAYVILEVKVGDKSNRAQADQDCNGENRRIRPQLADGHRPAGTFASSCCRVPDHDLQSLWAGRKDNASTFLKQFELSVRCNCTHARRSRLAA